MELDSTPSAEETSKTRCTFCFPCFGSRRSTTVDSPWWKRVQTTSWSDSSRSDTQPITGTTGDQWWSRGFMKIREWSEIVAGPRWKTFIRRFNRNKSGGFRHTGKYQYDPLSYALNFDEGQNGDFETDSPDGFRNFSARYVAPLSFKSGSTDLEQNVVVSS